MTSRRLVPAGAAALALTLAGCTVNVNTEGVTAQETQAFKTGPTPTLTLDTFDGAIEVHSWDRDEVEVIVEKQAQDDTLLQQIVVEKTQEGDRISLRVRGPAEHHTDGIQLGVIYSPSARLRVAVPRRTTLDLTSSDGSISVEDVSGPVVVRTKDGSVRGLRLSGDIRVRTDDGSIRLREVEGMLDVETLDGSIGVSGVLTHLRAKSGDGSVRVAAEKGSALGDDWTIETEDGSVDVRLPEGVNAEVDALTRDGSIRSSYPGLTVPEPSEDDERADDDRRALKATLGSGGRTIRVRTGDGSIRFES